MDGTLDSRRARSPVTAMTRAAATGRLRWGTASLVAIAILGLGLGSSGSGAAVPRDFYGVVDQGGLLSSDFPRMQKAGVGTLRFLARWPAVQTQEGPCEPGPFRKPTLLPPDPGNLCDWNSMDYFVGGAAANGIEALPFLFGSASFARKKETEPPLGSGGARDEWRNFVSAAVRRYGPGGTYWTTAYPIQHPGSLPVPVTHWQVWNEENSPAFWKPRPSPKQYAQLLRLTSSAIRSSDPASTILLGGMFATPHDRKAIHIRSFLRALYRAHDIKSTFDAVSLHPYARKVSGVADQLKLVRAEMRRDHDRHSDVWVSEIGWASGGPHDSAVVTTLKGQAKMLKSSFKLLRNKRRRWHIAGLNWYAWHDVPKGASFCAWCPWSGLVDRKGRAKPALNAFKGVAR
jgi:hypothetical protein